MNHHDAIDREGVRLAVEAFLRAIGDERPETARTPERVADAAAALFAEGAADPVEVLRAAALDAAPSAPDAAPAVIEIDGIELRSLCEHHLLPFVGEVTIRIVPRDRIAGFGAFVRVVDAVSSRLQLQERLTAEIADAVWRALEPAGVEVTVRAAHGCVSLRGRRPGAMFTTVETRGEVPAASGRISAGQNETGLFRTDDREPTREKEA